MNTAMQPAAGICSVPLVEVSVDGHLDLAAVPQIRRILDDALTLRPVHLVLDLAGCPVIDAAGIGLLLDVHRELWKAGSRLTLHAPTARLRRLLGIAHMDRVFHILPDAETETPFRAAGANVEDRSNLPAPPVPATSARRPVRGVVEVPESRDGVRRHSHRPEEDH